MLQTTLLMKNTRDFGTSMQSKMSLNHAAHFAAAQLLTGVFCQKRRARLRKDVLDVFTLQCPRIGSNQGIDFFTNLTIQLFDDLPGYYIESWGAPDGEGNCNGADGPIGDLPFCRRDNSFADMIVYLEVIQDASGDDQYESSIQFQCQEDEEGIVFTALNFLTKSPTITDEHLERMFQAAINLGLEWAMEWGTGTLRVDHADCIYPMDVIGEIHEEWQNGRPVGSF